MKFKVFAIYAMRFTVCVALAFYCVGVYAQRKEVSYFNDSVEICPLADKELIDSCYNQLDRNMVSKIQRTLKQLENQKLPNTIVVDQY